MHLLNHKLIPRRSFLRATGVSVALPLLEAMLPGGTRAWAATPKPAKRLLLMGRPLGMHLPFLFPTKAGKDYELTPYLKILSEHRNELTVISGMSHADYAVGHGADIALFTGAPYENISNPRFIRNTVSVDQAAIEKVGNETRYPCLVLSNIACSWTRKGTRVPSEGNAPNVFMKMFVDGKPDEIDRLVRGFKDGRSLMDVVRDQAHGLEKRVSPADRSRLDQYFTSIREAEIRLQQEESWVGKPKPQVDAPLPEAISDGRYLIKATRIWYDLMHLALQTDSTRIITYFLNCGGPVMLGDKTTLAHHDLSHHGQDHRKIEQLAEIEREEIRLWGELLGKLKATKESEGTLLDNTMVFLGSNLSNANSHSNQNLPILLAGGGFKHGQHLAYDADNNRPLCDLYLTILQRFGVETDRFGGSKSTISELV